MAFTINSTVREILANEDAKRVLEKHIPGATRHPDLHMALPMTLREVSTYPESGLTPAKLDALLADLARIRTDTA